MKHPYVKYTDNREEWAKKVLSKEIPDSEMGQAIVVLYNQGIYEMDHLSKIEPRKIASNWNKGL